jgi:RNA polymerase sigma-70 factor (ECF subfamily)
MQTGDDDAFEAFVRQHCGQMLLVARRILRNDGDANDAVQDAFLSAFKGIGRFEGQSRRFQSELLPGYFQSSKHVKP